MKFLFFITLKPAALGLAAASPCSLPASSAAPRGNFSPGAGHTNESGLKSQQWATVPCLCASSTSEPLAAESICYVAIALWWGLVYGPSSKRYCCMSVRRGLWWLPKTCRDILSARGIRRCGNSKERIGGWRGRDRWNYTFRKCQSPCNELRLITRHSLQTVYKGPKFKL